MTRGGGWHLTASREGFPLFDLGQKLGVQCVLLHRHQYENEVHGDNLSCKVHRDNTNDGYYVYDRVHPGIGIAVTLSS